MSGHQAPCRKPAWPRSVCALRSNSRSISLLFLVAALALLAFGVVFAAGCGTEDNAAAGKDSGATTTAAAKSGAQTSFPVTVTDDTKQSVTVKTKPVRIVSTAPSNTEILFALGLGGQVVGVSSLDDYPAEAKNIAKVGDSAISSEKVLSLNPDLVVGYSGAEDALKPIKSTGIPVLIMNPSNVDQIYTDILTIGKAAGVSDKAATLVDSMKTQMKAISNKAAQTGKSPKVFYAVDNTLWTCGPGSFVDNILTMAHATNVASLPAYSKAATSAYYQFTTEQLVAADPDIILLPNTAYKSVKDFTGDARFAGLRAVKEGRVYMINDVVVTRPGPRVVEGLQTLVDIVHPAAK